jgi:hypothetical protein
LYVESTDNPPYYTNNNTFIDFIINNTPDEADICFNHVYSFSAQGYNNILLNVSGADYCAPFWAPGYFSWYRQWYVDVNASNGAGGAVSGANVSFYNASNLLTYNSLTNSTGQARFNVSEHYHQSGVWTYYNNYSVNATKTGYSQNSTVINVSENKFVILTLQQEAGPQILVESPLNNTNFNSSTVDFNVSLNEEGSWCGFSLDNAGNTTLTAFNSTYFNYTNTSTSEGLHNITFSCNDTSNNYASTSLYLITIDTIYPGINFTSPTPSNGSSQTANSIYVNLTSNDTNLHYSFVNFDNSLVLWMRGDDTNQSTGSLGAYFYDLSSYGNNGTAYGDAHQVMNGKFGKAMSFDGNSDYVDVDSSSSLLINNSATWSFWAKQSSVINGAGLISKYDTTPTGRSYAIYTVDDELLVYLSNDSVSFNGYSTSGGCGFSSDNIWTYITVVYNSTDIIYYKNGDYCYIRATEYNHLYNNTAIPLWIGRNYDVAYFNGSIDEVMIFNRSLSAAEIQSLYNASAYKYQNNFTNLSYGTHRFTGYAVDIAGNKNQTETRNFTILTTEEAISISLSPRLGQQINWSFTSLPLVNESAEGNNNTGVTLYFVNISVEGTTADLYVKASGDLMTQSLDALGLGNETYSFNLTNSSVPSQQKFSLTTNYSNNKIGDSLATGNAVYLKFFLNAPSAQPAGTYNNTLTFKAVQHGQTP